MATRGVATRILLAVTLALGIFPVLAPAAHADVDPGAESAFVADTNALRGSLGLPPLQVNSMLVAKARSWAQQMATVGALSHSSLSSGITANWYKLGENVGRGPSEPAIHAAFVASPEHYKNLTDPGFRYVGVGVVNSNGTIYVAEEFMQLASQPAPSTPAPAAGTPPTRAAAPSAAPTRNPSAARPRTSTPAVATPHAASTPTTATAPALESAPPPPPPPPPAPLTAVVHALHNLDR